MSSYPPIPNKPRPIRASAPQPDGLRGAYLDLLKLSLCDLVGVSTRHVWRDEIGRVFSRELADAKQLSWRVDGSDWPLNGLTMVGLRRLDDLQACIDSVVADGIAGDMIEVGAWRGGASIFMRAALDTLGAADRTVLVADSFQGFPAPDAEDADHGLESEMLTIDYLAPSLADVQSYFVRFGCEQGVEFLPGFFETTLQKLAGRQWSLIRLDADGYYATRLALDVLYPCLAPGGYLIIDDYFHFHLGTCRKAVDEFRSEMGISEPIERIDWTGARWRRTATAAAVAPAERQNSWRPRAPRAAVPRSGQSIPTDSEVTLEEQLAALQARVDSLVDDLEQAHRSRLARRYPWRRPRARTGRARR
jgi:Macrocin-O-methyltransferase (TylF)